LWPIHICRQAGKVVGIIQEQVLHYRVSARTCAHAQGLITVHIEQMLGRLSAFWGQGQGKNAGCSGYFCCSALLLSLPLITLATGINL